MRKAICVIIIILLIALLAAAFWAVYKLSNGFTSDISGFFLLADNKLITEDINGASIFDAPIKAITLFRKQDLDVRIVRNEETDNFKFYADGEERTFGDKTNYTEGFDIRVDKKVITVKQTDMENILEKTYGADNVEIIGVNNTREYFVLVVSDKSSGKSLRVGFAVECRGKVLPQSITLNFERVTF